MPVKQTLTVGATLYVRFPALNKNDSLQRNDEEIQRRSCSERCIVEKVLNLTAREWTAFTKNLLADNDQWEEIGGSTLLEEEARDFAALCAEHGADPENWETWYRHPSLMEFYRGHCVRKVVAVKAPRKPWLFVNTEGYSYARYVGRI
jgi:uncharacterized protein YecE (DUF72 family)